MGEKNLKPVILNAISFADEKLNELSILADACNVGLEHVSKAINDSVDAINELNKERSLLPHTKELDDLNFSELKRSEPFEERFQKQKLNLKIPLLPLTTIGSFPQTEKVRQCRNDWKNNKISNQQYEEFINKEIKKWIEIQEELELDVLVHGEPERTDMVEYFGTKLNGFTFTDNGWIQSYGSRCVKPPIIYGNVSFIAPMTVRESAYAQSLTRKPVKGMLTGPVTILNWSFVRNDIPRSHVCFQIAYALRQEVFALEQAGIRIIQVDEPAVREGLPLKKRDWNEYLDWAVKAFRCATCKVEPQTQIHTHMCYCEFQDIIEKIVDLDADVISIETSRSHGEMITAFEKYKYSKGIGLGVYDIHSPRVPSKEEIIDIIVRAIKVVDKNLFWVNPDCGLKTRGEHETIASLRNMVAATKHVRKIIK